ncbi:hypothetical protein NE237_022786 [Protea cynaroides]|uniref:Uncharacterized protein n=1 Tax=Protea cynaroides TaxID=273540 RepID=A0A9Q0HF37_9MAGN|nr:hypothetical protein NE237_022786 [Protea cynaroides]
MGDPSFEDPQHPLSLWFRGYLRSLRFPARGPLGLVHLPSSYPLAFCSPSLSRTQADSRSPSFFPWVGYCPPGPGVRSEKFQPILPRLLSPASPHVSLGCREDRNRS